MPFFSLRRVNLCKGPFDCVQPRAGCRDEVECPSRLPRQPCTDFGLFMRSVIIQDDMDGLVGGHLVVKLERASGRFYQSPTPLPYLGKLARLEGFDKIAE